MVKSPRKMIAVAVVVRVILVERYPGTEVINKCREVPKSRRSCVMLIPKCKLYQSCTQKYHNPKIAPAT